ncbi:cupin domain-containing protein [Streptomyces angustmyceticus]|uniref:cupin domain-containing protein n=1 Tax=Streptomyces angustmyceticus TaxID=285578 RepID=UPI0021AFBFA8|nr:cupin domain-containing protein [Streptomyces angustmyceticus]
MTDEAKSSESSQVVRDVLATGADAAVAGSDVTVAGTDAALADPDVTVAVPGVSVVGPEGGEVIVMGATRMRVLEDGSRTGHRLGMAESVLAPHTPGPPQHRHARHDEGFYVISGSVRFTVGDEDHDATAGTFVMVPRGAPHTFANLTGQPAVMLSMFTPDLYVQYFRDLQNMAVDGRPPAPRDTIDTMSRYATEPASDFA